MEKGLIDFSGKNEFYDRNIAKVGVFGNDQTNLKDSNIDPTSTNNANSYGNSNVDKEGIKFKGKIGNKPLPPRKELEEDLNTLLNMRIFCVQMVNNNDEIDESKFKFFNINDFFSIEHGPIPVRAIIQILS